MWHVPHAIQVGSRIDYRLLLAGSAKDTQNFEQYFKTHTQQPAQAQQTASPEQNFEEQSSLRLRNASEGNTRLMRPIANLDTFLQLANILTILLCGIAIGLTSQRYVQQNQDHIALLRCIGASKRTNFSRLFGVAGFGLNYRYGHWQYFGRDLGLCFVANHAPTDSAFGNSIFSHRNVAWAIANRHAHQCCGVVGFCTA